MAREVRIALIMGGGVSLGSFSGGALSETLRLLDGFPASRSDATGGEAPLVPKIDVVTGASAGSMTLGIVLRLLLAGRDVDEVSEVMKASWVDGVGINYPEGSPKQLLPRVKDHKEPSLFSTDPIYELADEHLVAGLGTSPTPSPLMADTVYASFAVANLHGVDVAAPAQLIRQRSTGAPDAGKSGSEDAIKTTFHDDQVRFRIETTDPAPSGIEIDGPSRAIRIGSLGNPKDPNDPWSIFRLAAIASGSFPAAFPPVHIERRREEYGRLWPPDLKEDEKFRFAYVDGGTFRNEPLREAIELAALRDANVPPDSFERVFILIDPSVSGSGEVRSLGFEHPLALATKYDDAGSEINAHELTQRGYPGLLVSVLARVAMMVKGQSGFRDWLRTAKLNSRVEWEKKLTQIIAELAARDGTPALRRDARNMLEEIYLDKTARGSASDADAATKDKATQRREEDRSKLKNELGDETSELALDLILGMRNVAGLRRKRHLNMISISPWSVRDPPIALAGNFIANFGGFFDKGWRDFDYDAGRFAAHHMLTLKIGSGVNRLIRDRAPKLVKRRPTMDTDPRFHDVDADTRFRSVDPDVRKRFMEVLREHVERIANEALGVPDFLDDALSRFVKPKIESAIGAPEVKSHHVVVRITGPIKDVHELKKSATGSTGDPVELPDGSRVLETIVEVRERQDQPLATRYDLVGPHVLPLGDWPQIWVVRDTVLTREKRKLRIRLKGKPQKWFKAAKRRRLLEAKWEKGLRELDLSHSKLTSFS